MKTLIESSIKITAYGLNMAKTIFQTENKEDSKYFDISELAGKKIYLDFSYTDGEATKDSSISVRLDKSVNEIQAKDVILAAIQNALNGV